MGDPITFRLPIEIHEALVAYVETKDETLNSWCGRYVATAVRKLIIEK
jgi:predicted HicB family RNase H-like nuclease